MILREKINHTLNTQIYEKLESLNFYTHYLFDSYALWKKIWGFTILLKDTWAHGAMQQWLMYLTVGKWLKEKAE